MFLRFLILLTPAVFFTSCATPTKGAKVMGVVYVPIEKKEKPNILSFRKREREQIKRFVDNYFSSLNEEIKEENSDNTIDKLLNAL